MIMEFEIDIHHISRASSVTEILYLGIEIECNYVLPTMEGKTFH